MSCRIRYVNWGIANRFPGKIEMNSKLLLPKYILLRNEILAHEMKHSDYKYTFDDFKQDFRFRLKHKWLYRWFILTTPSSWVNFSPFYRSEGKWYIDYNILITWCVSLFLLGIVIIYYG